MYLWKCNYSGVFCIMKTTNLIVRMTEDQKEAIRKIAESMGFKGVSEYIRKASLHPSQDLTRIEKGINELERKDGLK